MVDSISVQILLAWFTSVRRAKGPKGAAWCEKFVGGAAEVLRAQDGGINATSGEAGKKLQKYCRCCGA
jgi:hypothetical protein